MITHNEIIKEIKEIKEIRPPPSSGNAEWLHCKVRVCGVASVIQDLDRCCQHMDCTEARLVRDTLVLMRPTVDFLDGQLGQFWVGSGSVLTPPPVIRTFVADV